MPYTITIDPARRLALIVGKGPNDLASSLAAMDELAARADFLPGYGMLCDFRENDYAPGVSDAPTLAEVYSEKFRGRPMAVVVSSLLHYGIANMITTLIQLRGIPVAAYRDVDEAAAWIESSLRAGTPD